MVCRHRRQGNLSYASSLRRARFGQRSGSLQCLGGRGDEWVLPRFSTLPASKLYAACADSRSGV